MKHENAVKRFHINEEKKSATAEGFPELEGIEGWLQGENIALFRHEKYGLTMVNLKTQKMRKWSTEGGDLLVENDDIDIKAIQAQCEHGIGNASSRCICYALLNTWDGFKDGYAAICWTLYPDGEYFADEDGFGVENNNEETVYGIINTDFEIVAPFRPLENPREVLKEWREGKKG